MDRICSSRSHRLRLPLYSDLGNLEAKATLGTLCRVPQTIPEAFFAAWPHAGACVKEATAVREVHCHEGSYVVPSHLYLGGAHQSNSHKRPHTLRWALLPSRAVILKGAAASPFAQDGKETQVLRFRVSRKAPFPVLTKPAQTKVSYFSFLRHSYITAEGGGEHVWHSSCCTAIATPIWPS